MSDYVLLFGCDNGGNTAAYILQFDILSDLTINLGIKTPKYKSIYFKKYGVLWMNSLL